MMNQPLRRVDPLGRSAAPTETRPTAPRVPEPMTGSAWPICGGSVRAIVDTVATSTIFAPCRRLATVYDSSFPINPFG